MKVITRNLLMCGCSALGLILLGACQPDDEGANVQSEAAVSAESETVLVDFDADAQKGWISSKRENAFSFVTEADGNQKIALSFSPEINTDTVSIKPDSPWDLQNFSDHNIAFDVQNLATTSTQLYVNLEDVAGAGESRSISLPAGFDGTVFFPITGPEARSEDGLWGVPTPWETQDSMMVWRSKKKDQITTDKIAKLDFATVGILEERNLKIDNLRIRQNPERTFAWLENLVDKYGQNTRDNGPLTVKSDEELRKIADAELAQLAASEGMPDRSKFGGYKDGPKLEATGYFRVEKVDGKWWMVDPEGYLFFSHGPANVRMANMTTTTGIDFKDDSVRVINSDEVTPEDSMGIIKVSDEVRQSRYVTSPERNKMFEWLPAYDDPLAEHYSYRRSTHMGPVAHGETYSFYRANLERRYGEQEPESYIKKWEEVTLDRMKDWGFTSFGNWVDPAFYPNEQVPYFANGWIIGDFKTLQPGVERWSPMPDFFDPVFAERAKATISVIAEEVQGSPWCAGIFVDNEKAWGELEGSVVARYGVITDALSKDAADSPAKAAFTAHLKDKYDTIDALNAAWNTNIADWTAFEASQRFETYTDAHVADLSGMLEMLGEQYFKVVHGTLEEYLPNHLYMGARMANWGMPPEIIKASVKYSDALSFNIYEEGVQEKNWAFLEEIDLPTVIGEFHIGTTSDSGLYNPGIVHAHDQKDRARMYKQYMQSVLDNPYFVGAHWFQYMDEPVTGRAYDGENANIGFVNVADIPYPELVDAAKEFNAKIYSERYGK
ncbi:agarase [Hirschia litorea]|uniref:Agarase n=1 Tax=Hirschia litorea TaxID=1199156 RepID=A0ABW2INI7_9PROT